MSAPNPPLYDPCSRDFAARAHEVYDRLRPAGPWHWAPRFGEWVALGHAEVRAVIRHGALQPLDVEAFILNQARQAALPLPSLRHFTREVMIFQSGPGHLQARRFLGRALNHRPIAELGPQIEAIVADLSAALRRAGGGDLVADFALAVPQRLMAALLGISAEDIAFLGDCAEDMQLLMEREIGVDRLLDMNSRASLALDHLGGLCAERRRAPRDDGLSRMLELADTEPDLDIRAVAMRAFFLFVVGLDTTTSLLAHSMLALLPLPRERERWRRGEVDEAGAVEELLRFTTPATAVLREATEDCEVAGLTLRRGQRVTAVFEAANRDPAVFPDPHRVDLGRSPCPHLAFSEGVHACLGATLARLQGKLAIREFVRLPELRLTAEPAFGHTEMLRRCRSLPVGFASA